jgi:hypothetical protein
MSKIITLSPVEEEKFWPALWSWGFDFGVLAMSVSHMWYRQNDESHSMIA